MGTFDDWLAAMPVEDVRQRIADLERELEVMRLLERRHRERTGQVAVARDPRPVRPRGGRGHRLSPERAAILDVVRQHPNGVSPAEVARALGKETNPIQTNMSRMVTGGMLTRVGQGLYRAPTSPQINMAVSPNGTAGSDEEP